MTRIFEKLREIFSKSILEPSEKQYNFLTFKLKKWVQNFWNATRSFAMHNYFWNAMRFFLNTLNIVGIKFSRALLCSWKNVNVEILAGNYKVVKNRAKKYLKVGTKQKSRCNTWFTINFLWFRVFYSLIEFFFILLFLLLYVL